MTTPATCVRQGEEMRTCGGCGAIETRATAIDPKNHVGGTELRNAKTATEAEEGYTGDTHCKSCGVKLEDGQTIPKLAPQPTPEPAPKTNIAINNGLKISQTNSQINITWGKVKAAGTVSYEVYVQYCGKDFSKKPVAVVTGWKNNSIKVIRLNGKKLNLKKNYKIRIVAIQTVDGKKTTLCSSITGHIVGRKNVKYTTAKGIKLEKTSVTLEAGKSAQIQAKTILVNRKRKQLSDAHAKEFRYDSSDGAVATVSKSGKITAKGKGKCVVYVYARNGYARTINVNVK